MRITYKNTFLDVMRFQIVHQFFSMGYQAIIVGLSLVIYFTGPEALSVGERIFIALAWYVLGWVLQVLVTAFILLTKRGPADKAEHIIEIQPEALMEETVFNRSFHFWNSQMKAVQCGGVCAIYVTPLSAHVIPKRAFSSRQHRQEFMSLLRQKLREQRGGSDA